MLLLRQASFFSFMGIKAGVETQRPQGPGRLPCQLDVLPGAYLLPVALHASAAGSVLTLESCWHLRRSSRYIKPSAPVFAANHVPLVYGDRDGAFPRASPSLPPSSESVP